MLGLVLWAHPVWCGGGPVQGQDLGNILTLLRGTYIQVEWQKMVERMLYHEFEAFGRLRTKIMFLKVSGVPP